MKTFKLMTEKEFNIIKTLTNNGLTGKQIEATIGRSRATSGIVKACSNWEDYLAYRKRQLEERRVRENLSFNNNRDYPMLKITHDPQSILDALNDINKSIQALTEEVKSKRRIF